MRASRTPLRQDRVLGTDPLGYWSFVEDVATACHRAPSHGR